MAAVTTRKAAIVWLGLTRAQRRTLRDPSTGTSTPLRSLRVQGLIDSNGLTSWGRFVLEAGER